MCGIGGLTLSPRGPIRSEWLDAFLQDLAHRGPDDAGWVAFDRKGTRAGKTTEADLVGDSLLIHRRLAILDLSDAGHQPMRTPDGRYWITFNGEIYNYVELREELKALGHTFHSQSDTEVLLAAYQRWGREALTRLIGMYAFAVLDRQRRTVLLARDCFGIKPLFYARWQEGLAFSSEIAPLLRLPGVSRNVHPQRLYDYLRSGLTDHSGETLLAHIRQLPAAHVLEASLDDPHALTVERYWDLDRTKNLHASFPEAAAQVRTLFLDSVRLHLRSDVPVGAALSGGVDSSAIVSAMRRMDPTLDIHTFSYIAEDSRLSEERWVDVVTRAAGLHAHKIHISPTDIWADMERLIALQGEPFSTTSMYAQWRVFQAARSAGIKVMLDGQGADELLAGYPNYRLSRLSTLLRAGRFQEALTLAKIMATGGAGWTSILRAALRMTPSWVQTMARRTLSRNATPAWMNLNWFRDREVGEVDVPPISGPRYLREDLYRTLTATSLPQLLRYEDRNSMAFSIESRVPFLTPALAQYLQALPEEYLLSRDGTNKAVFRAAMRGIVPDAVLDRKDKVGFPTPERNWLLSQASAVRRILTTDTSRGIGALDQEQMLADWDGMVQGTRSFDSRAWRWVNLVLWTKRFAVSFG